MNDKFKDLLKCVEKWRDQAKERRTDSASFQNGYYFGYEIACDTIAKILTDIIK